MPGPPTVEQVKINLQRLRRGLALARPTALNAALDPSVRQYLCRGSDTEPGSPAQLKQLTHILRHAISQLAPDERIYAEVDLNLSPDHHFPTLTDRQESLAQQHNCAAKTIRRRGNQALDTLAYLLVTDSAPASEPVTFGTVHTPHDQSHIVDPHDELRRFCHLTPGVGVDLVCSEIPHDERPYYASPRDRNYLRYAKFADLDTLIFVRNRLAQLEPTAVVRDFAPSEYFDTHADVLTVIGGPPWNAKYREFLPQLPFHFEPHPLGEDDPLIVPELDNLTLSPHWTTQGELVEDLAVLARLTVRGTTVFLLGGCLTLGVLGAARCLLDTAGPANVAFLTDRIDNDDFVVVTEARRIGGITDISNFTTVEPLLLMSRATGDNWGVVIDNSKRYRRFKGES